MSLNYWKNPQNPNVIRLYVGAKVFRQLPGTDSKATKIWIEPSETLMAGWVIKAKGDISLIGKGLAFQNRMMDVLAIDPSMTWADLLKKANQPATRKRQPAEDQSVPRAFEALNLDIPSIKMVAPISISVDHREPPELVQLLASHSMITVESGSLDLGDILIEDRDGNQMLIERKRCDARGKTDFENSVQDGRLFDQTERLKMQAGASNQVIIPIVLLEGDIYGNSTTMLCQAIDGAISFLAAIQRVSVLPTYNLNHTAYVIAKLASHFIDGLYTSVTLHKGKPKAVFDQQRYALEALPGVSTTVAEALLVHFGSVRRAMSASREELLSIKGLGQKKVDALLQVLDGLHG